MDTQQTTTELLDELLGQLLAIIDMDDDAGRGPAVSMRDVKRVVSRAARLRGIDA